MKLILLLSGFEEKKLIDAMVGATVVASSQLAFVFVVILMGMDAMIHVTNSQWNDILYLITGKMNTAETSETKTRKHSPGST